MRSEYVPPSVGVAVVAALAAFVVLSTVAHASPVLVAHYALDDTGTTILDSSEYGTAADGTRTNTNISTGTLGVTHMEGTAAARFDGVSGDSINLGQPTKLNFVPGSDPFSVVAWVRVDPGENASGTIVAKAAGANRQYQLFLDSGKLSAHVGGTVTNGNSTDITAGTVHLAAMTVSQNAMTLYVDGDATKTGSIGTSTNPNEDVFIGARTGGSNFMLDNAWVDDVGFWNGVLTAPQVKAIDSIGREASLGYDLGLVEQLFDHYDAGAGAGELMLDDLWRWEYATGLTTVPGRVDYG